MIHISTLPKVQCLTAFQTGSVPVYCQQATENIYSVGPEV